MQHYEAKKTAFINGFWVGLLFGVIAGLILA
jgi:hypothetical protein